MDSNNQCQDTSRHVAGYDAALYVQVDNIDTNDSVSSEASVISELEQDDETTNKKEKQKTGEKEHAVVTKEHEEKDEEKAMKDEEKVTGKDNALRQGAAKDTTANHEQDLGVIVNLHSTPVATRHFNRFLLKMRGLWLCFGPQLGPPVQGLETWAERYLQDVFDSGLLRWDTEHECVAFYTCNGCSQDKSSNWRLQEDTLVNGVNAVEFLPRGVEPPEGLQKWLVKKSVKIVPDHRLELHDCLWKWGGGEKKSLHREPRVDPETDINARDDWARQLVAAYKLAAAAETDMVTDEKKQAGTDEKKEEEAEEETDTKKAFYVARKNLGFRQKMRLRYRRGRGPPKMSIVGWGRLYVKGVFYKGVLWWDTEHACVAFYTCYSLQNKSWNLFLPDNKAWNWREQEDTRMNGVEVKDVLAANNVTLPGTLRKWLVKDSVKVVPDGRLKRPNRLYWWEGMNTKDMRVQRPDVPEKDINHDNWARQLVRGRVQTCRRRRDGSLKMQQWWTANPFAVKEDFYVLA